MTQFLFLVVFASVVLAISGLPRGHIDSLERRSRNVEDDEDTQVLRSFPKGSFNELQLRRYCRGFQEHYMHFCIGKRSSKDATRSKIVKFCMDYDKYCPNAADEDSNFFLATPPPLPEDADDSDSLVIPPKLPGSSRLNPTMDSPVAFDLPISDEPRRRLSAPDKIPLTPEIVKSCTADCTLPHCTDECKCAHTYPAAHMMCNPPPSGDLVGTCNKWYQKCPMFKPVSY